MTPAATEFFHQILGEIDNSSCDPVLKAQMKDLAISSMKFNNGDSTQITDMKDVLVSLIAFNIRQEIRQSELRREQAKKLEENKPQTKLGRIVQDLKPIAWPIVVLASVAFFSPHFPSLLEFLKHVTG